MNVWWQKIFDLFVVGGYLALDFVNNFTNGLKDFLSGLDILLRNTLC
ncbi:hypothetical protein HPIN_04210 [Helicobacter pylori India7]|uniref:Glutamyl-tRNA amidotransferase n=1 Tax=Helicobacter pylori (strain India7) TaxID=907238 RepID=E8QGF6_HELP7|nr:hypothetical protein HPIN_04210 [Helicobacter pylori India7]